MEDILDILRTLDRDRRDDIEHWFQARRRETPPFVTTSVDLRHSGIKLAPVDTNLYPAGFHNLSPAGRDRAARFLKRFLEERYPDAKHMLIIPENHTRNLAYRDNLSVLLAIAADAGVEAKLGSLIAEPGKPIVLELAGGGSITQYPLVRNVTQLALEDGFTPEVVLLNNDMTSGVPDILQGLAQPIVPSPAMGWWQRRKSRHFMAYKSLMLEFCDAFSLDPWLFSAEFHCCGKVDFKHQAGVTAMAKAIESVLTRVREKYKQYGIKDDPYVFIKADSGTYGMGIMTAHAPQDVLHLNKKTRNKMQVIKEGAHVSEVIIQEGVPTIDVVNGKPSEPMIYLIDGVPVGGMYRLNGERDALNNLNASGMEFTGMCDEVEDECGKWKTVNDCHFRSYGIVAAVAALAAAREHYRANRDESLSAQPCV